MSGSHANSIFNKFTRIIGTRQSLITSKYYTVLIKHNEQVDNITISRRALGEMDDQPLIVYSASGWFVLLFVTPAERYVSEVYNKFVTFFRTDIEEFDITILEIDDRSDIYLIFNKLSHETRNNLLGDDEYTEKDATEIYEEKGESWNDVSPKVKYGQLFRYAINDEGIVIKTMACHPDEKRLENFIFMK